MAEKDLKIALFSNTFGLRDAMGKHVHLIKKTFPRAEIYLERGSGDPNIETHNFYFVKRYPFLSLYMLEWKLGKQFKFLRWFLQPLAQLAFSQEAKKFARFDIVWLEWGLYHNAIHLFPFLRKQKPRPRLIFDYHGITPPSLMLSPGKKLIAQRTIKVTPQGADNADVCLVRSRFMQKELLGFAAPRKVVLNPLPLIGRLSNQAKLNLLQKYSLEKKKVLLYVGRISAHKNLEVVIRGLKLLGRRDVVFVVVGNYRHRSLQAEKERLVNLARELRIPDRLIFTGEVTEQELSSWYQVCDIFVMPSFHEGFCWPLLDTMEYGKPILASRFGAIPETVGRAALFFDARSPGSFAQSLSRILEDPLVYQNLVRAGKEKVREYTWSRFQNELREIVRNS